jgi:ubiquilin
MRQSLQMMSNPNAMQEAMRHQDLAMSRLENHPEGFNALRRMYEDVQEPLMEASQNAFRGQPAPQPSQQSNPWQSNTPNTAALPNPWGQRPAANSFPTPNSGNPSQGGFGGLPGLGGMPGMGGFPAGMPNMNDPAALSAMMQNPMMQQMLQNPELMMQVRSWISSYSYIFPSPRQMARMNPQLNSMLQANPQLEAVLTDPEAMRRMADPANLQAMIQMQQAMQQLQRSGLAPAGGLGMPPMGGGMFPGFPAPAAAPVAAGNTTIGGLDFSSLLSGAGAPQPSTASFSAPPSATSRSPEVRFESQLQQLEGMGFTDREANVRALIASNGNVNSAVERLLQ